MTDTPAIYTTAKHALRVVPSVVEWSEWCAELNGRAPSGERYLGARWWGTRAPEPGADYRQWIVFDFDCRDNPQLALDDCRAFWKWELLEIGGVPESLVIPAASGRKGFKLFIRALTPPAADWREALSMACRRWKRTYPTLDAGMPSVSEIRLPWSLHPGVTGGAWQIPLTHDWLYRYSAGELLGWCRERPNVTTERYLLHLPDPAIPWPTSAMPFLDQIRMDWEIEQVITASERKRRVGTRYQRVDSWEPVIHGLGWEARPLERHDGVWLRLRACPYCDRPWKAAISPSGWMTCFRDGCEAGKSSGGKSPAQWCAEKGAALPGTRAERQRGVRIRPREQQETLSLEQGRAQLAERVAHLLDTAQPSAVQIIRATPGVGKTHAVIAEIVRRKGRFVLAAETRELCNELHNRVVAAAGSDDGICWVQPRNVHTCMRWRQVLAAQIRGYYPGTYICPRCPHRTHGLCPYYEGLDRARSARVVVATYESAFHLIDDETVNPDALIIDEDPQRAFLDRIVVSSSDLEKYLQNVSEHTPASMQIAVGGLIEAGRRLNEMHREHAGRRREQAKSEDDLRRINQEIATYSGPVATGKRLVRLVGHGLGTDGDVFRDLGIATADMAAIRPGVGGLESVSVEEIEALPPLDIVTMIERIAHEARRLAMGVDDAPSLVSLCAWDSGLQEYAYRAYSIMVPARSVPTIILDAYATEEIYQRIWRKPVHLHRVDVEIQADVVHREMVTSRRAFNEVDRTGVGGMANDDRLFGGLSAAVDQLRADGYQRILVITYKDQVHRVMQQCAGRIASIRHWGAGRGVDTYRDHDAVVAFGVPEPPPSELYDLAAAIYHADSEPVSMEPHSADPRRYRDPRMDATMSMVREAEIGQSVHRIRPVTLTEDGRRKRIVMMGMVDCAMLPAPKSVERANSRPQPRNETEEWIAECVDLVGFFTRTLLSPFEKWADEMAESASPARTSLISGSSVGSGCNPLKSLEVTPRSLIKSLTIDRGVTSSKINDLRTEPSQVADFAAFTDFAKIFATMRIVRAAERLGLSHADIRLPGDPTRYRVYGDTARGERFVRALAGMIAAYGSPTDADGQADMVSAAIAVSTVGELVA